MWQRRGGRDCRTSSHAASVREVSRRIAAGRPRASLKKSPRLRRWAPTLTLSSTDMRPNKARFWKVRLMPRSTIRCGGVLSMLRPPNRISPPAGVYRRLTQLNKVVLPAPFGPIKPSNWRGARSNDTSSSATMPPKRTPTLRTASSVCSAGCQGAGSVVLATALTIPVPIGLCNAAARGRERIISDHAVTHITAAVCRYHSRRPV